MRDQSSLTRDRTSVPCITRHILNHWTTGKSCPYSVFLTPRLLSLHVSPLLTVSSLPLSLCPCYLIYPYVHVTMLWGLPWQLSSKESACDAGDAGLIPGWGRSPGGGHGNPLQYSCLENPMDGGAWRATVHGVTKSRTRFSN